MGPKFRVYAYAHEDDERAAEVREFLFAKAAKVYAQQLVDEGQAARAIVLSPDGRTIRDFGQKPD